MGDMTHKVASLSATPDPTLGQHPAPTMTTPGIETGPLQAQIAEGVVDGADLRLVIEEVAGSYVYKTVNWTTGETVAQYPREDVVRMREQEDYAAGSVVRTKV